MIGTAEIEGVEIDGTLTAIAGGIGSVVLAFVTAFFALRRTVVEATAAENQAFFVGLSDRLKEVENDLRAEQDRTKELRVEVIELREKLSEAKMKIAELEAKNARLEEERDKIQSERDELRREILELENRINDLEGFSEAVDEELHGGKK